MTARRDATAPDNARLTGRADDSQGLRRAAR
jgi:hypothetical protein